VRTRSTKYDRSRIAEDSVLDGPRRRQITGHNTISVHQRYRILNEDDRRQAMERMQALMKNQPPAKAASIRRGQ